MPDEVEDDIPVALAAVEDLREVEARITGMHCGDCVARLESIIGRTDGVESAEISFGTTKARFRFDDDQVSLAQLRDQVRKLGYDLTGRRVHFQLEPGVNEVAILQRLQATPGVIDVQFKRNYNRLMVDFIPGEQDPERIEQLIGALGASVVDREHGEVESHSRLAVLLISGVLIGVGAWFLNFSASDLFSILMVVTGATLVGYPIARGGFMALKEKTITINLLTTLAVLGAFTLALYTGESEFWWEGAAVVWLMAVGNSLEEYSIDRARSAIRSLIDLTPVKARMKDDHEHDHDEHDHDHDHAGHALVDVERLRVGDVVIIQSGERIPVDGVVVAGSGSVNLAAITGEAVPVHRAVGDEVIGGTLNEQGVLEVEVSRVGDDTTFAKIIRLVEEAQSSKAPAQKFIERFAAVYVPLILVAAAIIPMIYLLYGSSLGSSIEIGLVLLVVSCPCALVISTPISIVSAIANGARHGMIIKGGIHLERAARIDIVCFDKTGTVTEGGLKVAELKGHGSHKITDLLAAAAAAELQSEHHLGRAIILEAKSRGLALATPDDVQIVVGRGVEVKLKRSTIRVGSRSYVEDAAGPLDAELVEFYDSLSAQGRTVVAVSKNGSIMGLIGLEDAARSTAAAAVADLRRLGVETMLLTGDTPGAAAAIASELDIGAHHGGLLPADKLRIIKELQAGGKTVAMVGDGVNDAPALVQADVGIAMGMSGTDVAIESSDLTLMGEDLTRVPAAIDLARVTQRNVLINIGFSIAIVMVLVVATLLGWLHLAVGVLVHEGAVLLVIFHALQLLVYGTEESLLQYFSRKGRALLAAAGEARQPGPRPRPLED